MVEEKDCDTELTDAEAELYDRQIRLWGLESQKRLRSANILLIGLNGFGAEVAKNIILAGVKAVTFLDHRNLMIKDTCSQFLASKHEIGKNRAEASLQRAQILNPMVTVSVDTSHVDDKSNSYFANYNVVCASDCTITQLKRINGACREHGVKFFAGDVWGFFGYTFADLGIHEFVEDVVQSKKVQLPEGGEPLRKEKFKSVTVTIKRVMKFVPFENILDIEKISKDGEMYYLFQIMLNYREKYGKDPLSNEVDNIHLREEMVAVIEKYNLGESVNRLLEEQYVGQISPVCAIVGGIMGQEIIKAVSQKEAPHNNLFLFHPDLICGIILNLGYK